MVYSFDVFDTLITRSTAAPEGIFAIMRKLLQEREEFNENFNEEIKHNFYEMRIGAEQVARNTYCREGVEDVVLEQIYHVLVSGRRISEEESIILQALERQTEMDHVYGIPENISRVKTLLAEGKKVLLISDMYLDGDTIRQMLMKADGVFADIPLYVSSEGERKNKYSGHLFQYVKDREGLEYSAWKHFGDNPHSDFKVPQSLGISCELYGGTPMLKIENAYLSKGEKDGAKQLMAGCAKLARVGTEGTAYALGCGIGGPMLYPYVKWLLEDSMKRGIQRLYFIARDGYILKELAEALVKKNGLDIEINYIYGSRKAWRIPDSENLEKELLEIYARSYQDRIHNVSDLADFLQIPAEEVRKYVPERLCDARKHWGVSNVDRILEYLLHIPEFIQLLKKTYIRKKQLLVSYLQQELDMRDEHFAFVDLAGSGYTQECLTRVMRRFYGGKIRNYFYRMDCVKEAECEYLVFYPMHVPYFTLLEMMCRAPHEQTVGYAREENGNVVPVFAEVDGRAIARHGVETFIRGAAAFAEIYDEVSARYPAWNVGLDHIGKYLEYIYCTPDQMVLNYFGDIPNMLTGREKVSVSFAPKLSDQDIKNLYWYREEEAAEYYYKGSDLPYSLKRCTEKQKQRIENYMKYHDTWYGRTCRRIHKIFSHKGAAKMVCPHDYAAGQIAIYGAGKLGQRFYRQITGREKVQGTRYHSLVSIWMDQNYQEYQKIGLPVSSPKEAAQKEYEQLIIAVAKKEIADDIRDLLVGQGVEAHKIFWLGQFV